MPAIPRGVGRLLILFMAAALSALAVLVVPTAAGSGSGATASTSAGAPASPAADAPRAPSATSVATIADALRDNPVYVDPAAASQFSAADANALSEKIKSADKPIFVAVLPSGFPTQNLFRDLRTDTGLTGVYAIHAGNAFDARADSSALSGQAVSNLVNSVRGEQPTATQLNSFVDRAVPQTSGTAPASWNGLANTAGGFSSAGVITAAAVVLVLGLTTYTVMRHNRVRYEREQRTALEKLRVVVDEDITTFGEELDRLDFHPAHPDVDDAMRDDYERALDAYEEAKSKMAAATRPQDVRGVTHALDDGRFAMVRLTARRERRPLPERRPPCFFDPRHGTSVADVRWAPATGAEREVPVCAADEARLREGREPDVRTVQTAFGRRPYWEAGPAYGPWAGGYFGGSLLPGLLVGTLLGSMMASPAYAADYGSGYGGFDGGDYSGGDFDPGDFGGGGDIGGGGFGGGDFGGGFGGS